MWSKPLHFCVGLILHKSYRIQKEAKTLPYLSQVRLSNWGTLGWGKERSNTIDNGGENTAIKVKKYDYGKNTIIIDNFWMTFCISQDQNYCCKTCNSKDL